MLRRKFTPRLSVIRDQGGKRLQSQEVTERWTAYCDNLYKDYRGDGYMVRDLKRITPTSTNEPQDILYSQVEEAICSLKKNKISGPHGITAEMLQAGRKQLTREIHKLCSKAWQEGTVTENN